MKGKGIRIIIDRLCSERSLVKNALLELEELERIATEYESNKHYIELGKATKWLLEEWKYKMALAEFDQVDCTEGGVCITDADSLIDLYEGCKESEEYI